MLEMCHLDFLKCLKVNNNSWKLRYDTLDALFDYPGKNYFILVFITLKIGDLPIIYQEVSITFLSRPSVLEILSTWGMNILNSPVDLIHPVFQVNFIENYRYLTFASST